MTIQTEGAVASCKKELKNVLCKDRFPRCAGRTVTWGKLRDECSKAIESCPQKVRDSLQNIDLCRKLGNGDAPADRCRFFCSYFRIYLIVSNNVSAAEL